MFEYESLDSVGKWISATLAVGTEEAEQRLKLVQAKGAARDYVMQQPAFKGKMLTTVEKAMLKELGASTTETSAAPIIDFGDTTPGGDK